MPMTKETRACNALRKYFKNHYSEQEQEEAAFAIDLEKEDSYAWRMTVNNKRVDLVYNYETRKVEAKVYAIAS